MCYNTWCCISNFPSVNTYMIDIDKVHMNMITTELILD